MSGHAPLTEDEVRSFVDRLVSAPRPREPKALIGLIAAVEDLKAAGAAVQAEAAVDYDAERRAERAAAGVSARLQGRGIAHEIALARKESPHRGQTLLGLAKVLQTELRHTAARLADGSLNEFRAMLVARETACLEIDHRIAVDEAVCADPAALVGVGTAELVGRVKRLAARLDPGALAKRARQAETDRKVTVRPAPDTMSYVTGLLPVAHGVAVFAALGATADQMRAGGDPRSRAQLMADVFVARLTAQPVTGVDTTTGEAPPPPVPVAVNVTVPASTLAGGHDAATVSADGVVPQVVPAEVARLLISKAITGGVAAWFRQVYVGPKGRLVGMASKQRHFPPALADFLSLRGMGICATPWCDAPVRHADHVRPVEQRGPTTERNGQGLCEACNHAKQAEGWQQHVVSAHDDRQRVETITPTGHRYTATAPLPLGA
ncbi:MAG TPA: DUF222 domain-containing protein [Nocardioides sp.]|nr:DUF222 domain-containing protein [Nocardioides sp.]